MSYYQAKLNCQMEGEFKKSHNLIRITKGNRELLRQDPLSSPENVYSNMTKLIEEVNKSDENVITKAAYLAQEIWLHQPFVDGNKRTGRLLINLLTMQAGYPLFVFDDESQNYNSLLIKQYSEKKPGMVSDYIMKQLDKAMLKYIELNTKSNPGNGYRMLL